MSRESIEESPRLTERQPGGLRRSSIPGSVVLLVLLVTCTAAACVVGFVRAADPIRPDLALDLGVQHLSRRTITLGATGRLVLAFAVLLLLRRCRLDWLAIRPGPMEVRPVEDAVGSPSGENSAMKDEIGDDREEWLRRLTVEFREYLAGARLYETTSVPGDLETDRIIEVFRSTQHSGFLATLAAVWSYVWPTRAYIVSATLRTRDHSARYGAAVTVRRLPHGPVELETQWSGSFERALKRAAFAVTAHVLPSTLACRRPPWSGWRGRTMPVPLMRHYQRAKRMVMERRYDEALSLYHHALLYDADNSHLRYDVGQIFERLQLTPDALIIYADLTNTLFPPHVTGGRRTTSSGAGRLRRTDGAPFDRHDDPFLIRHRYTTTLATASRLTAELLTPDWRELREWLEEDRRSGPSRTGDRSRRPWRATELADLRRRVASSFDPLWADILPAHVVLAGHDRGLSSVLLSDSSPDEPPAFLTHLDTHLDANPDAGAWRALPAASARSLAVEQFFLEVALRESRLLLSDFERHVRRTRLRRRRPRSSLTLVVLELTRLYIEYRIEQFGHRVRSGQGSTRDEAWAPDLERMAEDLTRAGYRSGSRHWLEHYVAACFYSLPLLHDDHEAVAHTAYAEAAVATLERAARCGDDVEFVTSKKYWLLAGDPDLSGLRHYECFSAFESRVYLHPQPRIRETAKYELFFYLRQGLERGAAGMEQRWLDRAAAAPETFTPREVETWFRQERHAWQMCVRLGRFYRQWQTRSSGLENLRRLLRSPTAGVEPLPFPEMMRDYNNAGMRDPAILRHRIDGMERLFRFLANELGPASVLGDEETPTPAHGPLSVLNNTRAWIWFAEHWTRESVRSAPSVAQLRGLCRSRAAVWGALRHWSVTPSRRDHRVLAAAIARLPRPPDANESGRKKGPF